MRRRGKFCRSDDASFLGCYFLYRFLQHVMIIINCEHFTKVVVEFRFHENINLNSSYEISGI